MLWVLVVDTSISAEIINFVDCSKFHDKCQSSLIISDTCVIPDAL